MAYFCCRVVFMCANIDLVPGNSNVDSNQCSFAILD
jgi:hypothetical protein